MSYGHSKPQYARTRQCWKHNRYGHVCGLEAGHAGPCGFNLPQAKDEWRRDKEREYFKLWLADRNRN